MTLEETEKVLIYLHADIGKAPSRAKVAIWAEMLRPVPFALGMAAAKRLLKHTQVYGEPRFTDYREHVNTLHRASKDRAKGIKRLDPAVRAQMAPADVELYEARLRAAQEVTPEQASAFVGVIERKRLEGAQR